MAEFGFFILGMGLGSALVLSIWQWWVGRQQTNFDADMYTDYHNDYYAPDVPLTENDFVDDAVVTHVTKARKKRIKGRKKPVSKTRRAK
jgi:predicted alpha/beta hydrolase